MRIHRRGVGVDEGLEHIVGIELKHVSAGPFVARAQGGADLVRVFARQFQVQIVVFDLFAPGLIQGGLRLRPVCLAAVEAVGLVHAEIEGLLQQAAGVGVPLLNPLPVKPENFKSGRQVLVFQRVIQAVAALFETPNVGTEEKIAIGIHIVHVIVHDPAGQTVVNGFALVVIGRDDPEDEVGGALVPGLGPQLLRGDNPGRGAGAPRQGQGQQQPQGPEGCCAHQGLRVPARLPGPPDAPSGFSPPPCRPPGTPALALSS